MDLVLTVLVAAHQEFQAFQEALVPRDQQVLRVYPVAKVIEALVEAKALQVTKDLKDHRVLQVHLDQKVMQVLVEAKVPQARRQLRECLDVTGNSAFIRI